MIRDLTDDASTIHEMESRFAAGVKHAFDSVHRVSISSLLRVQRLYPRIASGEFRFEATYMLTVTCSDFRCDN